VVTLLLEKSMASPFQQQAFRRKLLYGGLILVLFTASWGWRRYVVDAQAGELSIREESRGDVELTGAVVRLGLTGSRGLATCVLWNAAIDKQKKNQWNELELLVHSVTKLQPHFIIPWLFQSWNLSYNVSVESDRVSDKYFFITRGIQLLAEGERQNHDHPDLRWSLGFFNQHKICQSDETNTLRSLFQLSTIPPNERDPSRFRKDNDQTEVNAEEFARFCQKYPQLLHRLRTGLRRESQIEQRRQFTCDRPEDVVQFLADNRNLPCSYAVDPGKTFTPPGGTWQEKPDELLKPEDRYPVLPPPRTVKPPQHLFDPKALTSASALTDDVDAYLVSEAWYAYAQEPIPDPADLPGSTREITDRARQRKPRYMTILIFRDYPAQAHRYIAERLQQEGWYDEDGWEIGPWGRLFLDGRFPDGTPARVGTGRKWSLDAWRKAADMWKDHGERNHLILEPAEEKNRTDGAEAFRQKFPGLAPNQVPPLRADELDPDTRRQYEDYRFMADYRFYRQVSNFAHHYHRALVEATEAAVEARKLFYEAEMLNLAASPVQALERYEDPRALRAWKEQVLLPNKEFRRDSFVQEQTAEIQWRYLQLWNREHGRRLQDVLVAVAAVVAGAEASGAPVQEVAALGARLLPASRPDLFPDPLIVGPFDGTDREGVPLIDAQVRQMVLSRLNLAINRRPTPPPAAQERPAPARGR
jgi:hypothetical protein